MQLEMSLLKVSKYFTLERRGMNKLLMFLRAATSLFKEYEEIQVLHQGMLSKPRVEIYYHSMKGEETPKANHITKTAMTAPRKEKFC